MTDVDLAAHAHALLDTNRYLTLATADAAGRPWSTPVYFAPAPGWRFYWMSETDARHSRNLVAQPHVGLVVFDSTVTPHHGRAVYAAGPARELADDEVDEALKAYPGPSRRGVPPMTRDDVTGSSPYRLYQATADELWVLCPREPGRACPRHGLARDHRAQIN
jgi:nitroimidazol reductase NimA-like FMN-containing flavoprotein (pyridoxamine 5'-phosphate oxidase superfamily)